MLSEKINQAKIVNRMTYRSNSVQKTEISGRILILIYIIITFTLSIDPVNGAAGDILINDEYRQLDSGKPLTLHEDYELTVTTIDDERISISLSKKGEVVWVKGGFIGYAYEYRNKTTNQLILRFRVNGPYIKNIYQYSDGSAPSITVTQTPVTTSSSVNVGSKTLVIGESRDIGHGYTLTVQSIDAKTNPKTVWLALSKDGRKLDDKILYIKEIYNYNNIFNITIENIYAGAITDMVTLSDTYFSSVLSTPSITQTPIPVATKAPISTSTSTIKTPKSTTLIKTPAPISTPKYTSSHDSIVENPYSRLLALMPMIFLIVQYVKKFNK